MLDNCLIHEGGSDLGFLALDGEDSFLGTSLNVTSDGATEEAIKALQRVEVLLAGLFCVFAFAKLHPVFKKGDRLGLGLLRASEDVLQILKGEIVIGIEGVDCVVDFFEDLADLRLGFTDFSGASLDDERLGIVFRSERDARG